MPTKLIFILILVATITSCNNSVQHKKSSDPDNSKGNQNSLVNKTYGNPEIIEINCDSIYKDKGISIRLIPVDSNANNEKKYKFIFLVVKQLDRQQTEVFRDTIESTIQEVKFADFNNDSVKDILIQNTSDVRSNWTYSLYLVDKSFERIRKVKGFEEIKNPNYLPEYDLIDNMVMSGRNWTGFYKIAGDTIKDFDIVIYDGEDENGKVTYESNYKKAIQEILSNEKTSL